MAKQMHSLQIVIEVPYSGGAQGTPRLTQVNHVTCMSEDSSMTKPGGQGPDDTPAVPRDLQAGDLSGSVQDLLDSIEGHSKSKEGIS